MCIYLLYNVNILTVYTYYNTSSLSAQTTKEAQEYFQRRMDYVTKSLEEVQKALQEKHTIRESKLCLLLYSGALSSLCVCYRGSKDGSMLLYIELVAA